VVLEDGICRFEYSGGGGFTRQVDHFTWKKESETLLHLNSWVVGSLVSPIAILETHKALVLVVLDVSFCFLWSRRSWKWVLAKCGTWTNGSQFFYFRQTTGWMISILFLCCMDLDCGDRSRRRDQEVDHRSEELKPKLQHFTRILPVWKRCILHEEQAETKGNNGWNGWIIKTDSGLRYKIINKGTGVKAEKGKMVEWYYKDIHFWFQLWT
jgi:hypothetical protein